MTRFDVPSRDKSSHNRIHTHLLTYVNASQTMSKYHRLHSRNRRTDLIGLPELLLKVGFWELTLYPVWNDRFETVTDDVDPFPNQCVQSGDCEQGEYELVR